MKVREARLVKGDAADRQPEGRTAPIVDGPDTKAPIAPPHHSISLEDQQPAPAQRRVVATSCIAYLVAMLALIPFTGTRLVAIPAFAGLFAVTVFIADICTFVLLAAQFLAGRSSWLLMLACAYLFSAIMAALHLLTFPGAIVPEAPLIGPPQTVAWLYIFWALGFIMMLLAAVVVHARGTGKLRMGQAAGRALALSIGGVLSLTGLLYLLAASGWLPQAVSNDRFSALYLGLNIGRSLLGAVALFIVWNTGRRRTNVVHLWLSLTLVAAVAGPVAMSLGEQRYTFGWYGGRLSFAFASTVVLWALLAEFVRLQNALARSNGALQAQTDALEAEIERRKLAERQLLNAQKMEAIGRVAGGVSHDFNNLLGAVISYQEVILRSTREDGVRDLAKRAKEVSLRGRRLTRSLLAFAQRQPLHAQLIDIPDLLNRFEILMQKAVGDTITLRVTPHTDTWPVRVDPEQLEIALLNLALNSRDAMPGGGVIHVTSENVVEQDDCSSSRDMLLAAGDYVVISISDAGYGIPPDQVDKVFDPFFTTKEVGKGTGLGLSQVRGFIRQSGGDAMVRSTPSEGTTVALYLPRAQSTSAGDGSPPRINQVRSNGNTSC